MSGVVQVKGLHHRYRNVAVLKNIELSLPEGRIIGVIGPDGAGKSTLLSLIAGATKIQDGLINVFGESIVDDTHRKKIYARIAFMPQGLGQNLYGDLSIKENIEFFAALFGVPKQDLDVRRDTLLAATGLTEFSDRRAANLSGGMKQKLGLCTTLIHEPDLLILDEPTTGVDPLSRRSFWHLIRDVARRRATMTVLVATAYMDEAETFDWLVMINAGQIFAAGTPAELKQRAGMTSLAAAYQTLLAGPSDVAMIEDQRGRSHVEDEIVIEAKNLTRRFGNFTAVDGVNLRIRRGEIYGFIGPNGSGKTTTMKMLTGLLPPTAGTAHIFGSLVKPSAMQWRHRLGYMSQHFSLYSELTVEQNLLMHGRLFDLRRHALTSRIAALASEFDLGSYMDQLASDLPVGIRQLLSLAVATIHRPELLILDEPTSGVGPLARDKLWTELRTLSLDRRTTIFVSTHYLSEAERCDRIALMNEGRLLAADTPQALLEETSAENLEDAFVGFIQKDRARRPAPQLAGGTTS